MKHYNPSIVERAQRIFNTKGDNLPDEVSGPVAVIPIQPITRIIRNNSSTASNTTTIYDTSADNDTYITGVYLSATANATNDCVLFGMTATIGGVARRIAEIRKQTLTAFNEAIYVPFTFPLKVDRGTAITIFQSFTAGASTVSGIIYGYTEEVTAN